MVAIATQLSERAMLGSLSKSGGYAYVEYE